MARTIKMLRLLSRRNVSEAEGLPEKSRYERTTLTSFANIDPN